MSGGTGAITGGLKILGAVGIPLNPGRRTVNLAPASGTFSALIDPPCWLTIACTIGKPSPDPLALVVKKGSNMRRIASSSIPVPLSSTVSTTSRSATRQPIRTHPPGGAAASPLSARFITT
jgi:hypothetical protein